MDYFDILLAKKLRGGGGGDITIKSLNVTQNGTYSEEGVAYSPVKVNVPLPENAYLLKDIENTPTAIATFSDGTNLPMPKLEVGIEPVQDLHGYDAPWVGGAGKNKLPLNVSNIKANNTNGTWSENAYTESGVTFTLLTDNGGNITGIKTNGTASANIYFVLSEGELNWITFDGSYIINGCSNGSSTTYAIQVYSNESSSVRIDNFNQDNYIQLSSSTYTIKNVMIVIRNGYTASNLMFYPMIRLRSVTDATFAPYSNICPISGWDEANITVADDDTDPTVEHTYTIPFTDSQGNPVEVYGGSVDVVNGGEQPRTLGKIILNGTENGWSTDRVGTENKRRFTCIGLPNLGVTETTTFDAISNMSKNTKSNDYINMDNVFILRYLSQYGTNRIDIITEAYQDIESFKAFLNSNNMQIVYELATPTIFYTQPTSIKSLDGENNVFASTGDVTDLEYFTH